MLGNRISKTIGVTTPTTTEFAYDANGNAWVDYTGPSTSPTIVARHIFGMGPDKLIANITAGSTTWYLQDILGSTRDLTNSAGTLTDHLDYNSFGKLTFESNPGTADRYQWTSREVDVELGLQYNRARYYDASTQRWISQDPMGFDAGDSNLYRYVSNDPTGGTDPSGLARSEVPLWVICRAFSIEYIQQKEKQLGAVDEAAKGFVKDMKSFKFLETRKNFAAAKDAATQLKSIYKNTVALTKGNLAALELAIVSFVAIADDNYLVLNVNQDRDDHNKVSRDAPTARIAHEGLGDVELPQIGKILGLKMTALPVSAVYSTDNGIAWCRVGFKVTFSAGIFKDHPLTIAPQNIMFGVTAKDDYSIDGGRGLVSEKGQDASMVSYNSDPPKQEYALDAKRRPDINKWNK